MKRIYSAFVAVASLYVSGVALAQGPHMTARKVDFRAVGAPLATVPPDPEISAALKQVSTERLKATISRLVDFNNRSTISSTETNLKPGTGVLAAAEWIKAEFDRYSKDCGGCLQVYYDEFVEQPQPGFNNSKPRIVQPTPLRNVYAILKGTDPVASKRMYLVTGHYDTRETDVMNTHDFAPGANDDSSGTAVSLEAARVLSKYKFPATIVFVAVAGEEQGLNGSAHLAKLAKEQGWQLEGTLNNDIVGGDTTPGDTLQNKDFVRVFSEGLLPSAPIEQIRAALNLGSENETPSRQLAREVLDVDRTYLAGSTATPLRSVMELRLDRFLRGGDHRSFSEQGFAAVRFTEWRENFDHQHQHVRTENGKEYGDLLKFDDFNYIAQVARLNMAVLGTLAKSPGIPQAVHVLTSNLDNDMGGACQFRGPFTVSDCLARNGLNGLAVQRGRFNPSGCNNKFRSAAYLQRQRFLWCKGMCGRAMQSSRGTCARPLASLHHSSTGIESHMDFLTRRGFLVHAASAAVAAGTPASLQVPTVGAPSAFGTAPAVGPAVTPSDFQHVEKLMQVSMTPGERSQAAANWQNSMAALVERRTGPRNLPLPDGLSPATIWDPVLSGKDMRRSSASLTEATQVFNTVSTALPTDDESIAFAAVTSLSHWIQTRQITSERLTKLYLARLKRYDPQLRCVITLTEEHALAQARAADAEVATGRYRGLLHGIPYGAKDLLDTAGIPTTYGAEPFRNRLPAKDSVVIRRLNVAGAVLVAKLSLGALALNDIWFGGQTMNPWLLEEGASGSSAGPGAAVAAGLVGFAIGSETEGSIVSPSMRCGVTGLRPTYGRVPRTGAMALAWSLDKLGPMARSVEDTMIVLQAISGADSGDVSSVDAALAFDATASVEGLRVGYVPGWMAEAPATDVDRNALTVAKKLGMVPVEVALPDWPYGNLNTILFAEAAASFEELTLTGADDQLTMQVPDAWPNTFRQSRFLSAVDFVQADRMRRRVALEMQRIMGQVDLLLVPSLRDEMLTISNFTGHPSLTVRAGFVQVNEARSDWAPDPKKPALKFMPPRRVPYGVTLIGRLYDEGTIVQAGIALEAALGASAERPQI